MIPDPGCTHDEMNIAQGRFKVRGQPDGIGIAIEIACAKCGRPTLDCFEFIPYVEGRVEIRNLTDRQFTLYADGQTFVSQPSKN